MSEPKVESFIFEDYEEVLCVRGETVRVDDPQPPPSMFGVDTLDEADAWMAEKVAEKFKRSEEARASGEADRFRKVVIDASRSFRVVYRDETLRRLAASLERDPPEMILPLGRQEDGRLLTAAASPVPTPPVTKPVLFDGYPLRHVVGYSLLEQWVEVLTFDDDEKPIRQDGKWMTQRLEGKVESITDRKDRG